MESGCTLNCDSLHTTLEQLQRDLLWAQVVSWFEWHTAVLWPNPVALSGRRESKSHFFGNTNYWDKSFFGRLLLQGCMLQGPFKLPKVDDAGAVMQCALSGIVLKSSSSAPHLCIQVIHMQACRCVMCYQNGKVLGTPSVVRFSEKQCFLGLFCGGASVHWCRALQFTNYSG